MSEQVLITVVSVGGLIALIARLWFLQMRADSASAAFYLLQPVTAACATATRTSLFRLSRSGPTPKSCA
jgi:hypothetical protein